MKVKKRLAIAGTAVALSVSAIAAAMPTALADANADLNAIAGALAPVAGMGIETFATATPVCGGPASIFPILVGNGTTQSQTGSITFDSDLAHQVGVFRTYQDALASPFGTYARTNGASCPGRPEWDPASGMQSNFTVGPGQQLVFWMAAGGMDHNLIESSHNIAIGGLPGGTSGQSWYDFALTLGADDNFKSIQLQYRWTGGINSDNNQNGFNVVQCATQNGQTLLSDNIISPYQGYGQHTYYFNQPICLGWFPEGTMMNTSNGVSRTGQILRGVQALQFDPTGKQLNAVFNVNPNIAITAMSSPSGPMATNLQGSAELTNCVPGTTLCQAFENASVLSNGAWFYAQTDGGLSGGFGPNIAQGDNSTVIVEGIPLKCNKVSIQIVGAGGATDWLDVSNIPNMPAC